MWKSAVVVGTERKTSDLASFDKADPPLRRAILELDIGLERTRAASGRSPPSSASIASSSLAGAPGRHCGAINCRAQHLDLLWLTESAMISFKRHQKQGLPLIPHSTFGSALAATLSCLFCLRTCPVWPSPSASPTTNRFHPSASSIMDSPKGWRSSNRKAS